MAKLNDKGTEVRAIQHALGLQINGHFNNAIQSSVITWQRENNLLPDGIVGDKSWDVLVNKLKAAEANPINDKMFFDTIRSLLFKGGLNQKQVDGLNVLLNELNGLPINQVAYALATAYHETAYTMQPIEEYGKGRGRDYGKRLTMARKPYPAHLPIYYGRGYVQLTWFDNYQKAGQKLNLDLIANPSLALQPEIAGKIMRLGMIEGWFTGKKLGDYIGLYWADYVNARRIINGIDKAQKIANEAAAFELALRKAKGGKMII